MLQLDRDDQHRLDLDAELAFLARPGSYPEPTASVRAVETHMSWVFLTDRFAYKLKKRLRVDHVDCCDVRVRRALAHEEVRLNRRLADGVYLGVVALSRTDSGGLRLEDASRPIDWLVKMRRLPAELALDATIEAGRAGPRQMRAVGQRLAGFYAALPAAVTSPLRYRRLLLTSLLATSRSLLAARQGLDGDALRSLEADQRAAMHRLAPTLAARVAAGMVVEGHGDLRPEHVYLLPRPVVIDCLEFSRRLRLLDRVDELGFLALECERHGAPRLVQPLLDGYARASGDAIDVTLVHFYQSLRASIRAFLAIRHLDEPRYRDSGKWLQRCRLYLRLAREHVDAALAGA